MTQQAQRKEQEGDVAKECLLLWSTQSGRAKACARRCARMIHSNISSHEVSIVGKEELFHYSSTICNNSSPSQEEHKNQMESSEVSWSFMNNGSSFDDFGSQNFLSLGKRATQIQTQTQIQTHHSKKIVLILFVSTTGDAEHTDSIQECWHTMLQKSLSPSTFHNIEFCLFALGDRAYGPTAFCAAGRKLASRLVQLGATPACPIGYGDDGTPKGGVFADLDDWIHDSLLPNLSPHNHYSKDNSISNDANNNNDIKKEPGMVKKNDAPYIVTSFPTHSHENNNIDNENQYENISTAEPDKATWMDKLYQNIFFKTMAPKKAYQYVASSGHRILDESTQQPSTPTPAPAPMKANIIENQRITASDWTQDVRHLRIRVQSNHFTSSDTTTGAATSTTLPYHAGDVAIILPQNSSTSVQQFIQVLPPSIQSMVDVPIRIQPRYEYNRHRLTPWPTTHTQTNTNSTASKLENMRNTDTITLRTFLTTCGAINALPEREDLRALSYFCQLSHPNGPDQAQKLCEMSEPSSDLYVDYILREKRTFGDVLYDFDSIGGKPSTNANVNVNASANANWTADNNILTIEFLLGLLPPLLPRAFSIASSPSEMVMQSQKENHKIDHDHDHHCFDIELCVAVVKGTTPLGRSYTGVCSNYLANATIGEELRLWIRPGSFTQLPLDFNTTNSVAMFNKPILCIGAGTGVAPLRSILREREYKRHTSTVTNQFTNSSNTNTITSADNILCFGCRKESKDFYYANEWKQYTSPNALSSSLFQLITAFSQDQNHKIYVQRQIQNAEQSHQLITRHVLEHGGAIYIAGGAKMARAVKDEILECLSAAFASDGNVVAGDGSGMKEAKVLLKRLQRRGLFAVEAWS